MPSRHESTARQLMLPAALILLISGIAFFAVLFIAANTLDRVAVDGAIHTVKSVIAAQERSIAKLAKDYTWWDAGFQKLVIERDPVFADNNVGAYAHETLEMSTSFVLDGKNATLHAFIGGKAVQADPLRLFTGGIDSMVERARAAPADEPFPVVGILRLGDEPHIVGASVFAPEVGGARRPEHGRRSVMIYTRALDRAFLNAMSDDYRLANLRFDQDTAAPSSARLVLMSPNGSAAGTLAWDPELPGQRLLRDASFGVMAAFLGMSVLLWVLLRRAQRVQRRLEGSADSLRERNDALQRSENALRTAKETVERTSRGKSEFLANLSHELRTPLNAIVGFAEIFESEAYGPLGNARYRDYSGHIHRSARHMLDLVNDTLDLSRAEVGRLDLIESEISIGQTIETCARMLSRQAEQAGIAISQSVEPALPRLRSDERRVRQIFLNLLSNAIKFTPSGGRVEVGARRHADGGMVVTVADSGIGIAEGDVEKALTPFTRLESGRLHHYEGAGIGLSLTRFLVELHGGQLTIDSEVGLGTRVSLHFPPSRTGG